MLNYGKNKQMPKRPKNEPKFSWQNHSDRAIIIVILISLLIIGALVALAIWAFLSL